MVTQSHTPERPSIWNLVAKNSKPIVRMAGSGGGTPFYIVHAIAGDVGFFLSMADMIADARAVYGIQVPTHKINAESGSSIHILAEYYVDELIRFQPEGPVILGGYSVGSTIALEMAQIMKQRGRDVALLVSFDGILYHTGARLPMWSPSYMSVLLGNVRPWISDARFRRLGVECTLRQFWTDWKLARACRAIERNSRANLCNTFLEEEDWPAKRLPLIRALYRAVELYSPKPYDGRVLVYVASVGPFFHLWQIERCWASIAPAADFYSIPCRHDCMFERHLVKLMGPHLDGYLSQLSTHRTGVTGPDGDVHAVRHA
jgi:pimeloyl-ACP methyl ester carboxylesterase